VLAESTFTVVCLDRDQNALRSIRDPRRRLWLPSKRSHRVSPGRGQLVGICSDLLAGHLPFASESFSLIVNVHFTAPAVFHEFARILVPGGHLFIETVGGHGGNYKQLPAPGELRRHLAEAFVLLRYAERAVRLPDTDAVTVKLLAMRKPR
jgi:SAM-dependent methyltransferase